MAKRKNWISYEQAKSIANEAGLKSRSQFMKWHKDKGIKDIPKQPNRVYSEWDGWPAFLETGNVFAADADKKNDNYMPFWDAVRWAQQYCAEHNITTGQGWKHAYAADRESETFAIPREIPKHPENYYGSKWQGWPAWLGKHLRDKIEAQKQQVPLLCLANSNWQPNNVITVVMAKDGERSLLEQLQNKALVPVRIFVFDEAATQQIRTILQECGKLQASGAWIVHNVPYLISEISHILAMHKIVDPDGFRELQAMLRAQADPNPADGWEELEDDKYTLKVGQNSFI